MLSVTWYLTFLFSDINRTRIGGEVFNRILLCIIYEMCLTLENLPSSSTVHTDRNHRLAVIACDTKDISVEPKIEQQQELTTVFIFCILRHELLELSRQRETYYNILQYDNVLSSHHFCTKLHIVFQTLRKLLLPIILNIFFFIFFIETFIFIY